MTLNAVVLGAGFIGSNFIRKALHEGYSLRVLDHKNCPEEFVDQVAWVQGDLSNQTLLRSLLCNADIVFHFISNTVPGDMVDEGAELIQNVVETIQLLRLCVEAQIKRLIFISSASVYGLQTVMPISENAPTNPISSHGIHKLSIEKYLQLYQYQYGLDCKIMRLSNPYGPGQSIDGRQGFIAIAIGHLLAGKPIAIRGNGLTVRDFVYIDDVTETLHLLAISSVKETIFNVGCGEGSTLNQLIKIFEKNLGRQLPVIYLENRSVDIPTSILDISQTRNLLGKDAMLSLEGGILKTLAFHGIQLDHQFNCRQSG